MTRLKRNGRLVYSGWIDDMERCYYWFFGSIWEDIDPIPAILPIYDFGQGMNGNHKCTR